MSTIRGQFCLLLVSLLAVTALALAQTTAGIRGVVSDPTGAVVPNATVTVTNIGTGLTQKTSTDSSGVYTFTLLPVGTYTIRAEAPGFKTYEQTGIPLTVNQVLGLNLTLQLGEVTQKVEISGGAPLVNTETTEVGTLVGTREVTELPLNGRNPIQLATLAPGISYSQVHVAMAGGMEYATVAGAGNASRMSVNGNRVTTGQYMLDGTEFSGPVFNSGIDYPNPDALQEFRFISSNYSAEFGKNPGGIMNAVTKSGTNDFHGGAWEFNRNSALAARSFFIDKVPFLNQNQFGFDVGGPIMKNKLFAFGTAQWLRIAQGRATTSQFPPTAAERKGDLSDPHLHPNPIIDPQTGKPFQGNIIPSDRLDPVVQKILNFLPLPNTPDGRFLGSVPEPLRNYQYMVKSDYNLSDRSRLSGSFYRDKTFATSELDFGRLGMPLNKNFATGDIPRHSNALINNTILQHVFAARPNLINQFRFAWVRYNQDQGNYHRGPTLPEMGSNYPNFPNPDTPEYSVSGRFFNSGGNFAIATSDDFQFQDSINYIRGSHNIKVGGEGRTREYASVGTANNEGAFGFSGQITGDAMADFLLGRGSLWSSNNIAADSKQKSFAVYVQDDFKVSRRVVLNLGLRYEQYTPWQPMKDVPLVEGGVLSPASTFLPSNFLSGTQSRIITTAPPGMVYPGDPGIPAGIMHTDTNDFEPRFGIAWDVFGTGRTSVRAGWGLFNTTPNGETTTAYIYSAPFFINFNVTDTPSLVNPFPPAAVKAFPPKYSKTFDFTPFLPLNVQALNPNMVNADIQQFNFTLQQELPGRISVAAAYVGNIASHLLIAQRINPAVYIPGVDSNGKPLSTPGNTNDRRVFTLLRPPPPGSPPTYGDVGGFQSSSNSNYNSLQVQARKEFAHGLSFLTSYTWSKAIDDNTVFLSNAFAGAAAAQNGNCRACERALGNYDQRNKFVQSFIYDTPMVTKNLGTNNPLAKFFLDSWELGGIVTLGSGFPFTVSTGRDNSLTAYGGDRPNLVGDPSLSTSRPRAQLLNEYFNPAAFSPNPIGTFGNLGRNTLIGPGSATVDASIFKNVPISERFGKFQLRAEFFNFLNRPNFGNPDAGIYDANVGKIFTAGPGRIVQFGAKYTF